VIRIRRGVADVIAGQIDGYVRVAAAVPPVRVTDFRFNREQTLDLWRRAHAEGVGAVFFPELGLAAYTAGDLHLDSHLLQQASESLAWLLAAGEREALRPLAFVGVPLYVHPGVYNCAAVLQGGRLLGIVPKSYLPNYGEFYDKRQFREGRYVASGASVEVAGQETPFGTDLLFAAGNVPGLVVGAEVCEDAWVQLPPNAFLASAGATVIGNLSGSPFRLGRGEARHQVCLRASGPGICAFVYSGAGPGESSSDVAYDSHAMIYENGQLLAESQRFSRQPQLVIADVDLEGLLHARAKYGTFGDNALHLARPMRRVSFEAHLPASWAPLRRPLDRHPFVPKDTATLATRCWEVFEIQTNALRTRMEHFGNTRLVLSLSGGRDSTLAALAGANALDQLEQPREHLLCVSFPGLGTSQHTRDASRDLAQALGATFEEEDIREECYLILRDQGHPAALAYARSLDAAGDGHSVDAFVRFVGQHPELTDVEFENVQARVRKLRVMMKANRHRALELGTGDLSEKALGWSTYAGDQIAMYDLNPGIPKTLVEFVIRWVANERVQTWSASGGEHLRAVLFDILEAPISPELLPVNAEGRIAQLTESAIGPFELHDFFLYWFVGHGARPGRILFLADQAFGGEYDREAIRKWLLVFFRRFFGHQWKRDCTADGPKVGDVALSPRGDWRMPSDAVVRTWIEEIEGA
jgi:NAD+ synthase (glutamine-hydrolysing)